MTVAGQGVATNLYRIEEEIAAGGMGTVFRATDVQLKRPVALKVLRSEAPELLERFLREQEITAELDHPGFVRILSMGYLEGPGGTRPFYAMPLLRGLTLEQLVPRRRRRDAEGDRLRADYTLTRLLQIVQQICLALQSAHDKRVVHRDLKPSNIIVGPYGEVYVADLGLAKHLGPGAFETARFSIHVMKQLAKAHEPDLTRDEILGTPYYMAPEQSLTPGKIDHRADIFGLGGILYFILTGRKPLYVEPPLDREELRERKEALRERLLRMAPAGKALSDLLVMQPESLPSPVRPLVEEYRELAGLLSGSDYYKLRLTMKACVIVPPREVVARRGAGGEEAEAADPIDPALEAICMKALAKLPEARFPHCRAMWKELQQYVEGRPELILKRKGQELARDNPRRNAPLALEHYAEAERRLHEAIARNENLGRLGIEDRLELFDILVGKARLFEQQGDPGALAEAMAKAEPLVESTLAVLERQFIQVLLAQGIARQAQGLVDEAQGLTRRAAELAEARGHPDLRMKASYHYGRACLKAYEKRAAAEDFDQGQQALAIARQVADDFGDVSAGAQARVALARLTSERQGGEAVARCLLDEALVLAASDPAVLSEVHTAFCSLSLRQGDAAAAVKHGEEGVRYADEAAAAGPLQEALLALGQAGHLAGNVSLRRDAFRRLFRTRGPRTLTALAEATDFYQKQNLDLGELEAADGTTARVTPPPAPVAAEEPRA